MGAEYEKDVARATAIAATMANGLQQDLDLGGGGLKWLSGSTDWRRSCLIGHYLISAVDGVSLSLKGASHMVKNFAQNEFSDNHWFSSRFKQVKSAMLPADQQLGRLVHRTGLEADRELELRLVSEHCLFHLAQALDRLAAVLVIAAALRTPVLQTDWGVVKALAAKGRIAGHDYRRQPPEGESLQLELLAAIQPAIESSGPIDWLDYLLRARNTASHRAASMDIILMLDRGKGMVRPLSAQPGWGELEAMLGTGEMRSIFGFLLNDTPLSTLSGLTSSTADLVRTLLVRADHVLSRRRADPQILVQPGSQWESPFEKVALAFQGYGDEPRVNLRKAEMHVGTDVAARFQAFRLDNKWLGSWRQGWP